MKKLLIILLISTILYAGNTLVKSVTDNMGRNAAQSTSLIDEATKF